MKELLWGIRKYFITYNLVNIMHLGCDRIEERIRGRLSE